MRKTITDKCGWIKSKEFIVWKGTGGLLFPVNFRPHKFQHVHQQIFIGKKNSFRGAPYKYICLAQRNFLV